MGEGVKVVAEIGINHNGSLEAAKQLILMAKRAGADYVKFQKRTVDVVYTEAFLSDPRESPWGTTQRAQKEGLEFGLEEYAEIDRFCAVIGGIEWFASAWDLEALQFLEQFNPRLHKVASPMLTNKAFLEAVAGLGRMTLISTGMSSWRSILEAAEIFRRAGCPFALLHCVSEYPCPDEGCNLGMLGELARKFPRVEVGYSNHSPGILSCIGAAFLGARWIETHITLDRTGYGSDQAASIEEPGLWRIVQYCKLVPAIIGDGIKVIRAAEKANAGKLRYWEGA